MKGLTPHRQDTLVLLSIATLYFVLAAYTYVTNIPYGWLIYIAEIVWMALLLQAYKEAQHA